MIRHFAMLAAVVFLMPQAAGAPVPGSPVRDKAPEVDTTPAESVEALESRLKLRCSKAGGPGGRNGQGAVQQCLCAIEHIRLNLAQAPDRHLIALSIIDRGLDYSKPALIAAAFGLTMQDAEQYASFIEKIAGKCGYPRRR